MSEILIEQIGVSPYAPVNLNTYQYNGLEDLSFGQLVLSVMIRRAAAIENQSVIKMNELTATSSWLEAVSVAAAQIFTATSLDVTADIAASGYTCRKTTSTSPTLREFLRDECGVDSKYLYDDAGTYDQRMLLFEQLRQSIDTAASQSQQQTIELQTLVSRRDVTYNTSATTVRSIVQSEMNLAATLV